MISFPSLRSSFRLLVASTLAAVLTGCGAGNFGNLPINPDANQIKLEGFVHGGQQPIVGSTVQLYAAGSTADQSAATALIAAAPLTDASGAFSITGLYTCPTITTEVYLIAKGGNPGLPPGTDNQQSVLMAALGPCGNLTSATHIIINEVTTIGSIYPITPFMASYLKVGAAPANTVTLANDFQLINQFIDTNGGQSPGPQLPGGFTAPVTNLNTLANSVSACVNTAGGISGDGSPCGNFLLYAKIGANPAPTNTADAILNIANNPTQNVNNIFLLSSAAPAFQPVLAAAPADWSLKILPNIVLTTPSNLVGVGSPTMGTISLGQAAPGGGLTVNLVSSNSAAVNVTTPVIIPALASSASFSYIGVAAGTSTITGTATGYYPGSTTLSATSSLISLGTIPTVAPGQALDLPLSLGVPAPVGGVTVNFTSSNPAVATVTGSSFIPAGLKIPASNPQVTGVTVGTANINATATGYAPGARNVSVSVTATLPTTFSVPVGIPTNETLTISAPAPAGGITFALTVDLPSIFSVPSTVTVPAGATTVNIPITGLTGGTTNLRADSPNITQAVSAVTVNGTISVGASTLATGKLLEASSYAYLATTPPAPTAMTFTSNNPSIFTVSTSPTVAGTTTVSVPNITSTSGVTYYVQGIGIGSGTLTISASGYSNTNVNITVDPSGFAFYTGSFATTTLSPNTSVNIASAQLNPVTSAVVNYLPVSPAGATSLAVASSNTAAGTIASPDVFIAGTTIAAVAFSPVGSGVSNLSLTTPAGFSTPSNLQQITATVTAPPIASQAASVVSGVGMEVSSYVYLTQNPVVPTTLTITSANPAVAVVSTSPTVAGAASANFTSVVNSSGQTFYIQGIGVGTTTITATASAYTPLTINITVDPSGFIFYSGNFSTTTFSVPNTIYAQSVILNPGTLTVYGGGLVSPQASPVNLVMTSATTTVGTITTSPLVFTAGNNLVTTAFQPVGAGTSNLNLTTPAGYTTPANTTQIVATVTAPPIGLQTASVTTGTKMQVASYVYLTQVPPAPVTVTVTSSNPAVALISTNATLAGAASNTFPNTVNSGGLTFYVQGQTVGTSTLTVTAPGYQSNSINVTVDPSGFIFYSGNIATTTFSANTTVYVQPVVLSPGTLNVVTGAQLTPGNGTVSVAMASSATQVGTITTPINFNGGDTLLSATFQPIAAGTTNITIATPAGFSTPSQAGTTQITATVTAPPILIQTATVITGTNLQTSTYAYLGQTPPSPVTVTMTIASPAIATISATNTVAGSGTLAVNNIASSTGLTFYVQGHAVGSTSISVTAPGFAAATINVTVDPSGFIFYSGNISTTTFSTATTVYVQPVVLTPGTLNVVSGGQIAPGFGGTQVTIASSVPGVGTVTTPFTFIVGDTLQSVTFQPVSAGTTNLTIGTPAGFSTPSQAGTTQVTATVTAPNIGVQTSTVTSGVGLQVSTYAYLGVAPPAPVTVTITANTPGIVALSKSPTVAGANSVSFAGIGNTSALSYYVQGLSVGSTTLTISAPGFNSTTINIASDPAGFIWYSGNFTTTTFSANTTVYVQPVILNPGVLTVFGGAAIGPGGAVVVPLASSIPGVGTVTSPITFNPGDTLDMATFQPFGAGATVLSVGTPAGFTSPSQISTQQLTATVTAPSIAVQSASLLTGSSLQISTYTYLSVTPPVPVTVTLTMANSAIATISTANTTVGTASINFPGIANSSGLTYYLQGQSVGSTTITISAPGYNNQIVNVTVDPSGFVITSPGNFTTTTASANTTINVQPAILNPGLLTINSYGALNPGLGTVAVPVGSTSPQVGSVSTSNVKFTAGIGLLSFTFHPLTVGTSNIVIVSQPAGFTAPSQPITYNIQATVN